MDLTKIYSLRQKFTIIAVTGRAGSGCSSIAKKLSIGFQDDPNIYPKPDEFKFIHNSYRKYRIIYEYTSRNFKPFRVISYKNILIAFILKYPLSEFINYLNSQQLKKEFKKSKLKTRPNFKNEIEALKRESKLFNKLHNKAVKLINEKKKSDLELKTLYNFFESNDFKQICIVIHSILSSESLIKRNKTLQEISNNQRGYGHPYQKTKFLTRPISISGYDGYSCSIAFVSFGNKITYTFWSPTNGTEYRGLTEFLNLCKKLITIGGLDYEQIL